jgi:polyhydroxybutyrate depolymerase
MTKTLLLLLVTLLGIVPAQAQAGETRQLVVNGVKRTYYLHVPAKLQRGAPLVIMLHGAGEEGERAVSVPGWQSLADSRKNNNSFVVVGPYGTLVDPNRPQARDNPRFWNSGGPDTPPSVAKSDDVAFILALIAEIKRMADIDERQVYVAGFSSGGNMANRLGQEIAGRLAAVSASGSTMMELRAQPPSRGVPILISAGSLDEVAIGVEGTIVQNWRTLNQCAAAQAVQAPANVAIEVSRPCRNNSEVRSLVMRGIGHTWPTSWEEPVRLTTESWEFFQRFRLPAVPTGN